MNVERIQKEYSGLLNQRLDRLSLAVFPPLCGPTIADHVRAAIRQLAHGETIGRRGTPTISFWEMKPKWLKWKDVFGYIGSDGSPFIEDWQMVIPALLQLVYIKTHDNRVVQLAYQITKEVKAPAGSEEAEQALSAFQHQTGILLRNLI